jgi:hypothetical protein
MKRVHEQEVNDWIEREVGARFDEGVMEQYTATALRVRIAHLCFDLVALINPPIQPQPSTDNAETETEND